jgi:hypothetical protein
MGPVVGKLSLSGLKSEAVRVLLLTGTTAMTAWLDLMKELATTGQVWGIIGAILAFKSPQLVTAFYAGRARLTKLHLDHEKKEKEKKTRQSKADEE